MEVVFTIDIKEMQTLAVKSPHLLEKFVGRAGKFAEGRAVKLISEGGRLQAEKTKHLRDSITMNLKQAGAESEAIISTNVSYAEYVHEGTGIYGPLKRKIVPVRAKALMITLASGVVIYRRSSRGMRPRPFFREALKETQEKLPKMFHDVVEEGLGKV